MPAGTVIDVDSLTVERIEVESNGMLRPVLVDLFGRERYLRPNSVSRAVAGRFRLDLPGMWADVAVM